MSSGLLSGALPPWRPLPYDLEARLPWKRLSFPDAEYMARITAVKELARNRDAAAALVCGNGMDFANVRYLTGFPNHYKGDVVLAVPVDGEPILLTNALAHGEPMHIEIYQCAVREVRCAPSDRGRTQYADAPSLSGLLVNMLMELQLTKAKIALIGHATTMAEVLRRTPSIGVEECNEQMNGLRAIKSPAELQLMRRAGEICDAALLAGLTEIQPGASERHIAGAIAGTMMRAGADEPTYIIQAVSGARSAFRNVGASDRILQAGDPVYVGFGLRHQGYCGRIGTATAVGRPRDHLRTLMEANVEITEASIQLVRPGVPVSKVVERATEMAEQLGVADRTITGGHGVGIHTHDRPYIQPGSADVFRQGMVFVFEPVIYEAGHATANAERLYEVTAQGCVPLSNLPLRVWDL